MAEQYVVEGYWSAQRQTSEAGSYAAHRRRANSRSRHSTRGSAAGHSFENPPPLPTIAFPAAIDGANAPKNALEGQEYLPPMTGPSSSCRQRYDSQESWGSSVMPAPLSFKSLCHLSQPQHVSRQNLTHESRVYLPTRDRAGDLSSPPSSGLEGWLRSQAGQRDGIEDPATGSRAHPPTRDTFASFAPVGYFDRLGSDAGSEAGEGGIGGRSLDKLGSASSRRNCSEMADISSKAIKNAREVSLMWEGDERPIQSGTGNLERWRAFSAIPPQHSDSGLATRPLVSGGFSNSLYRQSLGGYQPAYSSQPLSGIKEVAERPGRTPIRTVIRSLMKEGAPAGTIIIVDMCITTFIQWSIATLAGSRTKKHGWEQLRHWIALVSSRPARDWYTSQSAGHVLSQPPMMGWWCWTCSHIASLNPRFESLFRYPSYTLSPALSQAATACLTVIALGTEVVCYFASVLFFLERRLADRGRRTRVVAFSSIIHQPLLTIVSFGLGGFQHLALGMIALSLALFLTTLPNADQNQDGRTAALQQSAIGVSKNKVIHLSRKVSYSYVAATAAYLFAASLDWAALYFIPLVLSLVLGRCAGLIKVGLTRSLALIVSLCMVALSILLAVFAPWLSWHLLDVIRPPFASISSDDGNISCNSKLPPSIDRNRSLLAGQSAPSNSQQRGFIAIILLVALAYPSLIIFRAAKETVLIEMCLHEDATHRSASSQRSREKRKERQVANDASRRPTPAQVECDGAVAATPQGSSVIQRNATSITLSESGNDLQGLAESIVRGSSAIPSKDVVERPAIAGRSRGGDISPPVVVSSTCPSPSAAVLPYAASAVGLAFHLIGPVWNSGWTLSGSGDLGINFSLLPLTLLLVAKDDDWSGGANRADWQWAVFANNVGIFSMWPLLQAESLCVETILVVFLWNWLVGNRSFCKDSKSATEHSSLSAALIKPRVELVMVVITAASLALSFLSDSTGVDLTVVAVNMISKTAMLAIYLWSLKRLAEVGIGHGIRIGIGIGSSKTKSDARDIKAKLM